ncbi:hypothetical protein QFZ75_003696 [Streptomyces sp. V3I8]|uniref:hypothetical protein n=1 Tax=Streptomyces sp. V3I8 TaxID=3042279 RepID=UPI002786A18E|nr:hypothetical protein [Streptomyces sp. V3I8]MDQ1037280.1 hypothetical protein [Streptomyces sp. V3I8]
MSFTLRAEGLLADVVEQVTAADNQGDETQFEAVRAFVLAELEAWPTEPPALNGVLVELAGHHDSSNRNVTVVMRPMYFGPPED